MSRTGRPGCLWGLLLLLWIPTARAGTWQGIEPGTSLREEVVKQFGPPSKKVQLGGKEILTYRQLFGINQVQFRVETASGKVERIDLFPRAVVDRKTVESSYGPACGSGSPSGEVCYVQKLSEDARIYFLYPQRGLAVFFNKQLTRVVSFVYIPAKRAPPVADATAPGNETGEGTGKPPDSEGEGTAQTETSEGAGEAGEGAASAGEMVSMMPTEGEGAISASIPEDPLRIGGQFYVRGEAALSQSGGRLTRLANPNVVDAYFDGRPNEQLRGMIAARLLYDPTANALGGGLAPTDSLTRTQLEVQLDQFWMSVYLGQTVFVTLGKQHVKWGTGRLWNPTDFLAPPRRNLVSLFDERLGTDMVRVNLPLPTLGLNLYAVGLVDLAGPPSHPLQFGGAGRVEWVLGTTELSASIHAAQGRRPRYGLDFSSELGPLDVYGELAVSTEREGAAWRQLPAVPAGTPYPARFERVKTPGPFYRASGGLSWSHSFSEANVLLTGAEGYFNSGGQTDLQALPWSLLTGDYLPFYSGALYAAGFASFSTTTVLDSLSLTANVVANLSDQSLFGRADLQLGLLTDLSVEFSATVPFGRPGGEFNFAADLPAFELEGEGVPARRIVPTAVEFQLGLRFKI